MYSNLVPFEEILERVKDRTALTNLSNHLPKIRRMVFDVEKDLGWGGTAILKRTTYRTSDNTIQVTNSGGNLSYRVRIPEDLLSLEEVGMCNEGVCPGDYRIQGRYIFFCNPVEEFNLIYYSLLCDGEGNPSVTENHVDAVVSGITFFLYRPKIFNGKEGSMSVYKELEDYYFDRLAEARGDDIWPSTDLEWSKIADLWRMSSRDIALYTERGKCYSCLPEDLTAPVLPDDGGTVPTPDLTELVYFWQFDVTSTDISIAPTITQTYLDTKPRLEVSAFISGTTVSNSNLGRIAFALINSGINKYKIEDAFGSDITSVVFDTYYNEVLDLQIYISKEIYIEHNIYFKFVEL